MHVSVLDAIRSVLPFATPIGKMRTLGDADEAILLMMTHTSL